MGKGLSLQSIVDTASQLIEEKGYDNFSVRELAIRLNVKAASLYNHIDGVDDINREVGMLAATRLNRALSEAVGGKTRDEAIGAMADAYRQFVKDNPELYRTIIGFPILDSGNGLRDIGRPSLDVMRKVVCQYALPDKTVTLYFRSFRSALHGFVSLETAGYFSTMDVDVDESYHFMIAGYIRGIHQLESAYRQRSQRNDT